MSRRAAWVVISLGAWVLAAACDDDPAPSAIDAVVFEPPPGLGTRLDRVRLVVERLDGGGRFHDRTPEYAGATLSPVAIRVSPEEPGDVGQRLYRLRAEGYASDGLVVAQHHRVVFVPERTITLPFRLEASCLGVVCPLDLTCASGSCVDDYVPPCTLAGAQGAAFCRGDAGGAMDTAGPDVGIVPADMAMPDVIVSPDSAGACAFDQCDIGGACIAYETRNPAQQCEMCNPFADPTRWTLAMDYPCDDGLWCSVGERCDATATCVTPPDRRCFDGEGCTMDVCNEDTDSCEYPPQDGSCSFFGMPGSCCRGMCAPVGMTCV